MNLILGLKKPLEADKQIEFLKTLKIWISLFS